MKLSPQERNVRKNFELGNLSRSGFIGDDPRHIHDIVAEDARSLEQLGVTRDLLADRLKELIEIGKAGLESHVTHEQFRLLVTWDRGKIPCPFGDPGVHSLILAEVENTRLGKSIRYSQLSVHMLRIHGFLGGIGSKFRLDPERLVEVLEISKA